MKGPDTPGLSQGGACLAAISTPALWKARRAEVLLLVPSPPWPMLLTYDLSNKSWPRANTVEKQLWGASQLSRSVVQGNNLPWRQMSYHGATVTNHRVWVWDVCVCMCGTTEESQPLPDRTRGWAWVVDMAICLVLGFCGCHQHGHQKQVEEECIALGLRLSGPTPSPKEVGTQTGQEAECRSWCRAHGGLLLTGLLPSHGLIWFIICSGPPTQGWCHQ